MFIEDPLLYLCLCTSALLLMVLTGLGKHALERRQPPRRCIACGRVIGRDCRCRG